MFQGRSCTWEDPKASEHGELCQSQGRETRVSVPGKGGTELLAEVKDDAEATLYECTNKGKKVGLGAYERGTVS